MAKKKNLPAYPDPDQRSHEAEALRATLAFLDSPVGQLLKSQPEMTTREAMIHLGYWKKTDEE